MFIAMNDKQLIFFNIFCEIIGHCTDTVLYDAVLHE